MIPSTCLLSIRTMRNVAVVCTGLSLALLTACSLPRDVPRDGSGAGAAAAFGAAQARLDKLTATGNFGPTTAGATPAAALASYDWAKAQCWVRHAYSERQENDAAGFAKAALSEANKILTGLEAGNNTYHDTALVNHSPALRPDLWKQAGDLKQSPGFACAAQTTACLEVQLSRAGHERAETGWRHANSYIAIAEDMAAKAQAEADNCKAPPAPVAASPVVPAVPAPVMKTDRVTLETDLLFAFDRYGASDARRDGLTRLDEAVNRLKQVQLESVRVTGHTDPLGSVAYNQQLSERRATTVRQLLTQRGVESGKITAAGKGETVQVKACDAKAFKNRQQLTDCLQPNRRVEIEWTYLQK